MSDRRGIRSLGLLLIAGALIFAPVSFAQDGSGENKGVESGGYNIQQTIEFGYRANEINGNVDTYNTFVNLGSGVRLFDYSLEMRSINHNGLLFDNLSFSNFGYGGDPNDVSRLRVQKNKWYDFHALFRRDKNFWDYNLFANPLNPASPAPLGSQTSGCIVSPPSSAHPGLPGYCSTPSIPAVNSPHGLDLVRRMQDYDLTLFPQSWIQFRLGVSHDRDQGPGFFTTDSGTIPDFPQQYSYTTNTYRAGVDLKVLPRTTISYDQFLTYFKQDNVVTDNPTATPGNFGFQLANGTPVDLGVVWSTQTPAEALPCSAVATPIINGTTSPPTLTNSNCNGFLSYSQVGRPRNSMPTERVRFQSNYFRKFVTSGSVGYSTSDNTIPDYNEILNGFTTRSAVREGTTGGPAKAKRVSVNADWSGVYSVTDKFRIADFFRYDNWRIPGLWNTFETNIFGQQGSGLVGLANPLSLFTDVQPAAANTFAALCPTAPFNQMGCPLHSSSSGADVTNEVSFQFLGQRTYSNTFELQYDFRRWLSGHIGYLYTDRTISQFSAVFDSGEFYFPGGTGASISNAFLAGRGDCASTAAAGMPYALPAACTQITTGPDAGAIVEGSPTNLQPEAGNDSTRSITNIHEQAALLGIVFRPIDKLRITSDFEFGYNDNSFTRIDPRQVQGYKVHAVYTPKPWATLDGAFEIHENRDNVSTVSNREHDRSFSFSATMPVNSRLIVDFGYNYWEIYTQSEICFNYSISAANPPPAGGSTVFQTSPPGVATLPCLSVIPGASSGAAGDATLSMYSSHDHFAHADLIWKPVKRVSVGLGYAGSFVRGSTTFLNPLAPAGTLDYNYLSPFASISANLYKGLTYKMAWNYYGFNQRGNTSPFGLGAIPLQDFNGSNATFSFRYSF
ncbi:MAG: hypothetical protein WB780_12125 [Candidatus Acidiferrales bacterium]